METPTEAAAIAAYAAAGDLGTADECPGPNVRGVGVKNRHHQVCQPPSRFLKLGTFYSLWRPRDL